MDNNGQRYHKVGEFWAHFPDDLDDIIDLLSEGGYSVCETLDGDMIIMKPETYPDFEFNDGDDEDEEDWNGGYRPSS